MLSKCVGADVTERGVRAFSNLRERNARDSLLLFC